MRLSQELAFPQALLFLLDITSVPSGFTFPLWVSLSCAQELPRHVLGGGRPLTLVASPQAAIALDRKSVV